MNRKKLFIGVGIVFLIFIIISSIIFFLPKKEEEVIYKVVFDNEGVTKVVNVKAFELLVEPLEPEKDGYVFDGWYLGDIRYEFNTGVTQNMNLTAKWIQETAKRWVVFFDSAGGNSIDEINVVDGGKINNIPTPKKTGYTFIGWFYNNNKFDFDMRITKDITLVAKWELGDIVKYTVNFDTDGGSLVDSVVVQKNKTLVKPEDPSKEGYTFIGWFYEEEEFSFDTKITKDMTLVAKWESNDSLDNEEY